ncbi:MAG: IS1380 family transposase [Alphaproteobacteria bacterium]|nr:IS1380 family transposase [Alphaproteobacteria bacterium]
MVDPTPFLPGLSPVHGQAIVARFDGGRLSSEGGLLALREVEHRLGLADRLAACLDDPRAPERVVHSPAEIIRFRLLMIAAGYADGNDADTLRHDPMFKLALDRRPEDPALCSQSTISRLETLPDTRALLRLGRALIDQYCVSFRHVPKRIVLDIDDTFDCVHGGQEWRLFNAHHNDYGFQPIVVFDGEGRFITAMLRPAKRPSGHEIRAFVRRLVGAIRANWPKVAILLRADSHYAAPEVFDWCRANRVDWILGLAPNAALLRHVAMLEQSTAERFQAAPARGKVRRFAQFYDAAHSWSRVERIIARVEAGPQGADTRFIVTNLQGGRPKKLYEGLYRARGQAENHIKAWKTHLAADRTSCHTAAANQFRLFLHAGAYWLLWSLRRVMPKGSPWRVMQFDTLRLRLIKLAARVSEGTAQITIHLPSSAPDQAIFALLLERLPCLVT